DVKEPEESREKGEASKKLATEATQIAEKIAPLWPLSGTMLQRSTSQPHNRRLFTQHAC
ncbi:unnamed protein product, partial [Ilex paraguariensis]